MNFAFANQLYGLRERNEGWGNLVYWAVIVLLVAIVAAVFGFDGVAGMAMSGAHLLFWFAIVIFVVSTIAALVRRV